jgi:hypothetical protein
MLYPIKNFYKMIKTGYFSLKKYPQIVEKEYFSRQFFILSLQKGLLISAPGTRFPRGGPEASSALGRLRGLQRPLSPAGVECPPLQSTGRQINLKYCNTLIPPCVLQSFLYFGRLQ